MKKSKKLFFMGITILPIFTLSLTSLSCKNKNKINKLNEYAKDEFKLTIDASKYSIKEALDITKYTNNLKNDYKFNLVEIKEENNKIVIRYTISDKNNKLTSNVFEQTFNNFKNINLNVTPKKDLTPKVQKPKLENKYDDSKKEELLSLFNLEKDKLSSKNVDKFTSDKSNANFKLSEVKVNEFSDLLGTITILVKGKYNDFDFATEIKINDFYRPFVTILKNDKLKAVINLNKLNSENKTINDLNKASSNEILKYIDRLIGYDGSNNEYSLLELIKSNENYEIQHLKIENNKLSFRFTFKYKSLSKDFDRPSITKKVLGNYSNLTFEENN